MHLNAPLRLNRYSAISVVSRSVLAEGSLKEDKLMDNIVEGAGILIKNIMKCPLIRYYLLGLFLLIIMQRNTEDEPEDYGKQIYYTLRIAPTPTKLLTWPVRMCLCFLLALPNMPDFPLVLIVGEQFIFPYIFILEIISCLLLGLHVTNYCNKNASKCYYSNDDTILEESSDFRSVLTDCAVQVFVTIHVIYTMWLFKSIMHIIQLVIREIYKWIVRHVVPKVFPVCRVVVMMFVFNLQDAVIPILCVFMACKVFMKHWLMPLMDRAFTFPNEANDINSANARSNDTDDGNSSELSDEFEDINELTDEAVAA